MFPCNIFLYLILRNVWKYLLVNYLFLLLFLRSFSFRSPYLMRHNLSLIQIILMSSLRKFLFEKLLIRIFLKSNWGSRSITIHDVIKRKSLISAFICSRRANTFYKIIRKIIGSSRSLRWFSWVVLDLICKNIWFRILFRSVCWSFSLYLRILSIWNKSFPRCQMLFKFLYGIQLSMRGEKIYILR